MPDAAALAEAFASATEGAGEDGVGAEEEAAAGDDGDAEPPPQTH
jgi:hypothetical protein